MRRISAPTLAFLFLGALLASGGLGQALDYPSAPVSVIVPYGAGGGTDLIGRALVDVMKSSFPRGIAVENRTGGGGSVGMSYGQNARPDGNIITMVTVELVTLPHTGTGGDISYAKFKPIAMVNSGYAAITVQKSSPYNTLKDFVDAAKKNPLQVGNSGIGAIWHLAAAGLEKAAGIEVVHVPFNGAAPAITSLLGGHIDAVSVSYAEVLSQVDAGELKVLAVLAPRRLPAAPNVPTAAELGFDVSVGTWRGFAVPLATPPEIAAWLEKTFTDAVKSPAFAKFMADSKNDVDLLSSAQFAEKLAKDSEMFKNLIVSLKLNQ